MIKGRKGTDESIMTDHRDREETSASPPAGPEARAQHALVMPAAQDPGRGRQRRTLIAAARFPPGSLAAATCARMHGPLHGLSRCKLAAWPSAVKWFCL